MNSGDFERGDYTTAAIEGSLDDWRTHAARGLIGFTRSAVSGLAAFDEPQARFYEATAEWIGGNDERATTLLASLRGNEHAANLLRLLRKPRIHVLAQLPWLRRGPQDLLSGVASDPRFRVRNISFHPDDEPNHPRAVARSLVDPAAPPDFFITQMVEWHALPPDLQALDCPVIGHTADYDLHIQALFPWLQIFDELLVCDHTEWDDVRRLVRVPVSTFPKSFGVPERLPPMQHARDLDFFMTGTILHPWHPDKARLYHAIQAAPDINAIFVNGFFDKALYEQLLSSAKVTLTYVRHPGAMVSRGLEALGLGCALVVQRGSVLASYTGEQEGVLTYAPDGSDLVDAVRRIIRDWPAWSRRTRRGAEIIRSEFAFPRVASQYLRFATWLAARPRGARRRVEAASLDQQRMTLSKGWTHDDASERDLSEARLAHWASSGELGVDGVIRQTRELTLRYAQTVGRGRPSSLAPVLEAYREGLARHPDSLVLRFNLVRTSLHFGGPPEVREGIECARETLLAPPLAWRVEPLDDVLPWDFASAFFNYRAYFDAVTDHMQGGGDRRGEMRNLILASLRYYLSHYDDDVVALAEAVDLDPSFPHYRLRLGKRLLEQARVSDGVDALLPLVRNTCLYVEAFEALATVRDHVPSFAALSRGYERRRATTIFFDDAGMRTLQPLTAPPAAPPAPPWRRWLARLAPRRSWKQELIALAVRVVGARRTLGFLARWQRLRGRKSQLV